MSRFQVLKAIPRAGISAKNQKPYNMLILAGLHTDDLGQTEMGEVVFMEGMNNKLPSNIVVGQSYVPNIVARSRDGRLLFEIGSLSPIKPV